MRPDSGAEERLWLSKDWCTRPQVLTVNMAAHLIHSPSCSQSCLIFFIYLPADCRKSATHLFKSWLPTSGGCFDSFKTSGTGENMAFYCAKTFTVYWNYNMIAEMWRLAHFWLRYVIFQLISISDVRLRFNWVEAWVGHLIFQTIS